jgi:hypothetical protein
MTVMDAFDQPRSWVRCTRSYCRAVLVVVPRAGNSAAFHPSCRATLSLQHLSSPLRPATRLQCGREGSRFQRLVATGGSTCASRSGLALGRGGSVRRVVGAARNSLRAFAFGGASLPPHCRRAESADRAGMSGPRGVGRRAWSLGVRPAHAAGICPPPRPGQPTTRKKFVRVMSAASCSGTRVRVARARIVVGLPQSPRNESGHLKGSWRAFGRNIFPLLLWRLHAGRIRSLGAAGDLPAYSLA